jgi:flagellar assembly factor FliW
MNTLTVPDLTDLAGAAEAHVQFPLGLLGFEQVHDYTLIADPAEAPFRWLQAKTDSRLAFLVLSPFEVMPNYELDLSDEDARFLGLESALDALVFNIVTLRPKAVSTVNLRGPLVFNRRTGIGKQVVLPDSSAYAVSYPLAQKAA